MFVKTKNQLYHSYRTLMRTEKSKSKERTTSPSNPPNTVKKKLHHELKKSLFRDELWPQKPTSSLLNSQQVKFPPRLTKLKSKSVRNLFKNAHFVSKDQSFLVQQKEQQPYHFTCECSLKRKHTQSEKKMASQQLNKNSFQFAKQTIQSDFEDNRKYKHLTFEGRKKKYRRKYSLKRESKSNSPSQFSPDISYPLKIKQQTEKPSHPILSNQNQSNHSLTIVMKTVEAEEKMDEKHQINDFQTIQKKKSSQSRIYFKNRKTLDSQEKNYYSNSAKGGEIQQKSGNVYQNFPKEKKSQSYVQPDDIIDLKIQQITFKPTQQFPPKIQRKLSEGNQRSSQNNKTNKNQSADKTIQKNFKKNRSQQKNPSKKIKSCKNIQSSSVQMDTGLLQELKYCNQPADGDNKQFLQLKNKIDQSLRQKQESIAAQQKNEIIVLMNRLSTLKERLQLLGQFATFFSQKSKLFKLNPASQQFYRIKQNLRWHKLTYLNFKYFFVILLFCQECYKKAAKIVSIKRQQLQRFSQQNQLLKGTLDKIEKSVKKNVVFEPQDDRWFTSIIPSLQGIDCKEILNELEGGSGKSALYLYLDNLYRIILEESAIFIKSLFISKILNSENTTGIALKEAVFRVLNICFLLYLHRNTSNSRKQWGIEPIMNLSLLANPQTQLFRSFYNVMIQKVFTK